MLLLKLVYVFLVCYVGTVSANLDNFPVLWKSDGTAAEDLIQQKMSNTPASEKLKTMIGSLDGLVSTKGSHKVYFMDVKHEIDLASGKVTAGSGIAIKEFPLKQPYQDVLEADDLIAEARGYQMLQKTSQHPNILRCLGWYFATPILAYLVTDKVAGGDLAAMLKSQCTAGDACKALPTSQNVNVAKTVALQLYGVLEHFKTVNFIHYDIKALNILLSEQLTLSEAGKDPSRIKILVFDFDVSFFLPSGQPFSGDSKGTTYTVLPPEAVVDQKLFGRDTGQSNFNSILKNLVPTADTELRELLTKEFTTWRLPNTSPFTNPVVARQFDNWGANFVIISLLTGTYTPYISMMVALRLRLDEALQDRKRMELEADTVSQFPEYSKVSTKYLASVAEMITNLVSRTRSMAPGAPSRDFAILLLLFSPSVFKIDSVFSQKLYFAPSFDWVPTNKLPPNCKKEVEALEKMAKTFKMLRHQKLANLREAVRVKKKQPKPKANPGVVPVAVFEPARVVALVKAHTADELANMYQDLLNDFDWGMNLPRAIEETLFKSMEKNLVVVDIAELIKEDLTGFLQGFAWDPTKRPTLAQLKLFWQNVQGRNIRERSNAFRISQTVLSQASQTRRHRIKHKISTASQKNKQ